MYKEDVVYILQWPDLPKKIKHHENEMWECCSSEAAENHTDFMSYLEGQAEWWYDEYNYKK